MFHISEVRNAVYCGRQAYYESRREACRIPSPETRLLRETAYLYPTLVDSPNEALRSACNVAGIELKLDLSDASDNLDVLQEEKTELWNAVAYPDREEKYYENDELCGTVDKRSFTEDGLVVSKVKTGTPPPNGVWSSDRVEATAVERLVSSAEETGVAYVVMEYPRVGALRCVEPGKDDERALESALEILEEIKNGIPPSRTDNRSKCESCDFREECGVETRSILTRLKERFG